MKSSVFRLAGLAVLVACLTGCASGPADFADLSLPAPDPSATAVRDDADRVALERDLAARGDQLTASGKAADAGLPSAMALAIIRQQQAEEARKLLDGVNDEAAAGGRPDALCPATDPACPPAPAGE